MPTLENKGTEAYLFIAKQYFSPTKSDLTTKPQDTFDTGGGDPIGIWRRQSHIVTEVAHQCSSRKTDGTSRAPCRTRTTSIPFAATR